MSLKDFKKYIQLLYSRDKRGKNIKSVAEDQVQYIVRENREFGKSCSTCTSTVTQIEFLQFAGNTSSVNNMANPFPLIKEYSSLG